MFKIVSKMLDTEQYSVQIAVHLPPKTKVTFFGCNNIDTKFFAGQHEVTVINKNGTILFCSSGFSSASDAKEFVKKLSACVCLLSLKKKIGLRVNNSPQECKKPEFLERINNDPLNRDNRKIDGTIDSFSTFIIPDNQKIIDDGSMLLSPIPEFVPEQLFEIFSSIDSKLDTTKVFQNAKTELAFYIFSFNFIGNHPYSRFISLITCLEILSTEPKSSPFTCNTINKLNNFLKDYKKEVTSVLEKKEIDRLINRVGNLKKESIRLAVCNLIFNHYDKNDPEHEILDITNVNECNKITQKLYTLRSNLVHYGKPSKDLKSSDPQYLFDQLKILESITQDILYAEFKNQYFKKKKSHKNNEQPSRKQM